LIILLLKGTSINKNKNKDIIHQSLNISVGNLVICHPPSF